MRETSEVTMASPFHSRGGLVFLLFTALVCGALIMVIQVLGSRVIGPFFGVSLFVWTSLITVTLIALALGYWLGGLLADRRRSPDVLYMIILLAGLSTLCIPLVSDYCLQITLPLGLRMGAFISATMIFGPALFLLGCVSPYLVKIAAQQMQHIGRTVGGLYALSTLGSVIGTILTGFVLIAYLGVDRIFTLTGTVMVLLAVVYFVLLRKKWVYIAALLMPLLLAPATGKELASIVLSNGSSITLVDKKDSFYGSLRVIDYRYKDSHLRELVIDGLVQGGIDMTTGLSTSRYSYFLQFIPYILNPGGTRCLVLGLGAGIIPGWYEQQGIMTDTVDIDADIEELARRHFNFDNANPVQIQDARYALINNKNNYDFIILDVANGDHMPAHLFSKEAVDLYAQNITSQGVLGVNLLAGIGQNMFVTASIVKTLKTRFDQVEIYPTMDSESASGMSNLIISAYMGPPRQVDWQALRQFPVLASIKEQVHDLFGKRFHVADDEPAIILTDDYNPIDFYNTALHEKLRENIIKYTHLDLLL